MNNLFGSKFAKYSKFDKDFVGNIKNNHQWSILVDQFEKYKKKKSAQIIPKIIHQIWLGPKKLPKKYKKWIDSWKKYNPEWEYKLWNENNIKDLDNYGIDIYSKKMNPGFRSDIIRYIVLKRYGGLYIDTDFECLKSIPEDLLSYEFVSSIIFDNKPIIANGMIMSKPNYILLDNIIKYLKKSKYKNNIEDILRVSGPDRLTLEYFKIYKDIQENSLILPSDFFYPYPNFMLTNNNKYKEVEDHSIGIHHWEMSWMKNNLLNRFIRKINYILK